VHRTGHPSRGRVAGHSSKQADIFVGDVSFINDGSGRTPKPPQADADVTPDVFKALVKSRVSIPLKKSANLATFAGCLGSIVTVQSGE
jgi:hypothetical protein